MKQKKILFIAIILILIAAGILLLSSKLHTSSTTKVKTTRPAPSTAITLQKSGWKQFDRNSYNDGFVFNFSYPADWKASFGNAGPIFVSPDQKLMLTLREYSTEVYDRLALQETTHGSRLIRKSEKIIAGHPAIQQELLMPNGEKLYDVIAEYVGQVKNESRWPDGSPDVEDGTVVLGMTIMDSSQHDKAITLFNQILTTITIPN